MTMPQQGLELHSLVADGELRLSLQPVDLAPPSGDEVIVAVEAAPINPSDLGLLLGPADPAEITATGSGNAIVATAPLSPGRVAAVASRVGESMPVGNEGAGKVVAAGPDAQHLIGKTVALFGGSMYATHRRARAGELLVLPEGVTARQGAAAFVNPLTALSMVESMRMEGHNGLIHTAAASNLGQMLVRICRDDKVPLINIVRSEAQEQILRDLGASHVCNSSKPDFMATLIDAIAETDATLAFDAVGGKLPGQILVAMEAALTRGQPYSRYGSPRHKQVYGYGVLDLAPIEIPRSVGMAWSMGGYLLPQFLMRAGAEVNARMRKRVADELTTTFASNYTREVGLAEALDPQVIRAYAKKATGEKYLLVPSA